MDIFCDGSSRPRTKLTAGSACVIPDKNLILYSHIPAYSTNNISELFAIIIGLKYLQAINFKGVADFYSDSTYAIGKFDKKHETYLRSNSFKYPAKMTDKNDWYVHLAQQTKSEFKNFTLTWIRGHSNEKDQTNYHNLADKFANYGSDNVVIESTNFNGKEFKAFMVEWDVFFKQAISHD
jgi:ribonuclease HI